MLPTQLFLAAVCRAEEPDIVDSAMTREQALEGVDPACPPEITASQALLNVRYRSMDGKIHAGQILIHEGFAAQITEIFDLVLQSGFPVASVIPMAHPSFRVNGRWDDDASMNLGNSSGFNYRAISGTRTPSLHSCGAAIDLNTRLNPYVRVRSGRTLISPPGAAYDPRVPGTLNEASQVTQKFLSLGWRWGGNFRALKDWQHFERDCP